ncbi:MAG: signal peptidase I [Clostridia bacterium]|nr:signal peptidase I [Clostridia bacterium]
MKNKGKKILGVVSDILLILILVIAIVITVMTFTSKNSDTGIGNVFGYTPFSIQSDSMSPTFKSGDLIIAKEVKNVNDLKPGDVITYSTVLTDENGRSIRGFNTHRILDIEYNKDNTIRAFVTKGDGINTEDNTLVLPDEVIAKQVNSGMDENGNYKEGLMIANFGMALNFLQSRTGFMICIIIPLALFFIWQIYKLIAMFMEAKAADIDEETKKRAIEEYLAEQAAKQKAESGDEPKE